MTRFDAATPGERRKLFADAVLAHRRRSSPYLTVEVADGGEGEGDDEQPVSLSGGGDFGGDASGEVDSGRGGDDSGGGELAPPWAQFGDGVINLDCTDAELERLKDLVGEYPAFRIDEVNRPEDAAGTNVRITARADPKRIADFLEATFLRVYDRPEDYRAWVVEV